MERTVFLKYLKIQLDTDLKIILLDHQNNYVGRSSQLLDCQNFLQPCSSRLNVLHNYFDGPTKFFADLYLAKVIDTAAKLFFPCIIFCKNMRAIELHNTNCFTCLLFHFIRQITSKQDYCYVAVNFVLLSKYRNLMENTCDEYGNRLMSERPLFSISFH